MLLDDLQDDTALLKLFVIVYLQKTCFDQYQHKYFLQKWRNFLGFETITSNAVITDHYYIHQDENLIFVMPPISFYKLNCVFEKIRTMIYVIY